MRVIVMAAASYAVLFLLSRLSGRKQIAQLDSFDYVSGITIGSIAAELATELEEPLRPLLALLVYGLATWALTALGLRSPRWRERLNGAPAVVMERGVLLRERMKRAKLELSEFLSLCRQQGYFDLSAVDTAVFESNGQLSILPADDRRPATPQDLSLQTDGACAPAAVILDGRVMEKELCALGLDAAWLQKQLRAQGFPDAGAVFLALCGRDRTLSCYPMTPPNAKH